MLKCSAHYHLSPSSHPPSLIQTHHSNHLVRHRRINDVVSRDVIECRHVVSSSGVAGVLLRAARGGQSQGDQVGGFMWRPLLILQFSVPSCYYYYFYFYHYLYFFCFFYYYFIIIIIIIVIIIIFTITINIFYIIIIIIIIMVFVA